MTELSKEKGEAAERQQIYAHATELCSQLEDIVGQDTLKEAYYGGNLQALQEKVDALAGEKGYEALQDCLDRTLSKDPAERVEAMKEAQNILAKIRFQVRGRDLLQMVANVLLVVGAGVAIFQAVFLQVAGYTVFHLLLLTLRGRIDAPICQIVQNVR